jgi:hypothetical protein
MPRHAPESSAITIRVPNCMGTVRAGVLGSWSVTYSTSAKMVKMPTAHTDFMKDKGEPERLIQPK